VTQTLSHFSQELDPYTAAYFVFVTLTTIGFGDVNPEQSFKGKLDPSLSFIRLVKPRDLKQPRVKSSPLGAGKIP
jgi:hypothetical protein